MIETTDPVPALEIHNSRDNYYRVSQQARPLIVSL